ncbi:hypothetical protein MEX01_33730 [Methylorubrum extorquens]|nr:hypothetical protein MEX01_33730 [Methylorubrum extorquens]
MTTYIATASASRPAQTSGSQKAKPSYSLPKPNILVPSRLMAPVRDTSTARVTVAKRRCAAVLREEWSGGQAFREALTSGQNRA